MTKATPEGVDDECKKLQASHVKIPYSNFEKALWLIGLALLVFFGSYFREGLSPDAALYAGLSLKILREGEAWLLTASGNHFTQFFEHPPFFFQWGSGVLSFFGTSDGAARSIGAIPGVIAFLSAAFWLWWKSTFRVAVIFSIMAATWGHYTKFAATSLLEAPFSLGVLWVFISSFEKLWNAKNGYKGLLWSLLLIGGLFISTAAKGVMGLGAWGALVLCYFVAFIFSPRSSWKFLLSFPLLLFYLAFSLLPFAIWSIELFHRGGLEWVIRYFSDQVFRSATTNRGELEHPLLGDRLYYVKSLLRNGWPWLWTFMGGLLAFLLAPLLAKRKKFLRPFAQDPLGFHLALHVVCFVGAFAVPLSFLRYQLTHYLHPVYLPLLILGAVFLDKLFPHYRLRKPWSYRNIGWAVLVFVSAALLVLQGGPTRSNNRGQEFREVARDIIQLPPECVVFIAPRSIDSFRAEAYALWYWQGRAWKYSQSEVQSRIAVFSRSVYWNPKKGELLGGELCPVNRN